MVADQEISARIGAVTGSRLGTALREYTPLPVLVLLIALLRVGNVINLGADTGAMMKVSRLSLSGPTWVWAIGFAAVCAASETLVSYEHCVLVLKWLTLTLPAYIVLLFVIHSSWAAVLLGSLVPRIDSSSATLTRLVAVLGTTTSPELIFLATGGRGTG